jgi:CBS domain-containing protein
MDTDAGHARTSGGPEFSQASVADAMHAGVLTCPPETPLRVVARMMATHRVHSVVVIGDPKAFQDEHPWRVVSDLDLVRAGAAGLKEKTAADAAHSAIVTVSPADPLTEAASLMDVHGAAHLLVVEPESGHPLGVLSTLDLAGAFAFGRD